LMQDGSKNLSTQKETGSSIILGLPRECANYFRLLGCVSI
jgi:hypothetical protein